MAPTVRVARVVPVSLLLLLFASGASAQEHRRRVEFETVVKYLASGQSQSATYIINDAEQWEAVWRAAMSHLYPIPEAPKIDFNQHTVFAAFQGEQPSSGYSISFTKLVKKGKRLEVHIREVVPEDTCVVMLVITRPLHIVVTEKFDRVDRVTFKLKQRVTHCEPRN
jgi:hypothetical protein